MRQKRLGLKFWISRSRSTIIARVGVCTRPTEARLLPREPYILLVIALVPLMPTSQSDSLRHLAASCSDSISS